MLTDKDREWLEKREKRGAYYCYHCTDGRIHFECKDVWNSPNNCPLEDAQDFRDAAEFEARVAAKLVSNNFPCRYCPDFRIATKCPLTTRGTVTDYGPFPCLLRQARLTVEAEMEQEGK